MSASPRTPRDPSSYQARDWIEGLGLKAHPEGGWYREVYRSAEQLATTGLPERFSGPRSLSTSIYYLLEGQDFSALHRIHSDEVWHHYAGTSLSLVAIDTAGALHRHTLGKDLDAGEVPQLVVPAGQWFAATCVEPMGYSLVGCTVAPGFDFADFELAERAALADSFPEHGALIERFTRVPGFSSPA